MTEGWIVNDELGHLVDVVIEGECGAEPTTVVDFTDGTAVIDRVGAGDPALFGVDE